jgi:hypothetical protein
MKVQDLFRYIIYVDEIPKELGGGWCATIPPNQGFIIGDGETPLKAVQNMFRECQDDIDTMYKRSKEEYQY